MKRVTEITHVQLDHKNVKIEHGRRIIELLVETPQSDPR